MKIEELKDFAIKNEITLLEAIEYHKLLYLENITEALYDLKTV